MDFDLWVIGGSPKSVYEKDSWLAQLSILVKELHRKRKNILGLCFGHQMVAQALGGTVEKFAGGWEAGRHSISTTMQTDWMRSEKNEISLLYSHQDQVTQLPDSAIHLATNSFCANQMYQVEKNILCFQGHPEFSSEYMKQRLIAREDQLGESIFQPALNSLAKPRDEDTVITWIRCFFVS